MNPRIAFTVGIIAITSTFSDARCADSISPKEFLVLKQLIKPSPNEDKWAQIPWKISLWEARKEAARLGKPILLWEMDGHPLGCT